MTLPRLRGKRHCHQQRHRHRRPRQYCYQYHHHPCQRIHWRLAGRHRRHHQRCRCHRRYQRYCQLHQRHCLTTLEHQVGRHPKRIMARKAPDLSHPTQSLDRPSTPVHPRPAHKQTHYRRQSGQHQPRANLFVERNRFGLVAANTSPRRRELRKPLIQPILNVHSVGAVVVENLTQKASNN